MATKTNTAVLARASSQYYTITDAVQTGLDLTGDCTIMGWWRPNTVSTGVHTFVSKWDASANKKGYQLQFNETGNKFEFNYSSNGSTTTSHESNASLGVTTGRMYHVAMTFTASTHATAFYLDGNAIGTDTTGTATAIFDSDMTFGFGATSIDATPASFLDGIVGDWVVIKGTVLTQAQIVHNMGCDVVANNNLSNVQAYWKFDGGATDEVGNNTLTPVNTPTYGTTLNFGAYDTFFPDNDGIFERNEGDTTWAAAHDATTSSGASDFINESKTSDTAPRSEQRAGPDFRILRNAYVFDTSAIPDTDRIDSAVLKIYVTATSNVDNDGEDYIAAVSSTLADVDNFAVGDYDGFGTTEWSSQIDIGSFTTSAYNDFTFNATGISNISKTGDTVIGLREGHDILDSTVGSGTGGNSITSHLRASTGVSQSPRLEVQHSAASTARSSLLTTGVG